MRKKLFAILMSAMMMVTFMPAMAFADSIAFTATKWAADYSTVTGYLGSDKTDVVTLDTVRTWDSTNGYVTATPAIAELGSGYTSSDKKVYFDLNSVAIKDASFVPTYFNASVFKHGTGDTPLFNKQDSVTEKYYYEFENLTITQPAYTVAEGGTAAKLTNKKLVGYTVYAVEPAYDWNSLAEQTFALPIIVEPTNGEVTYDTTCPDAIGSFADEKMIVRARKASVTDVIFSLDKVKLTTDNYVKQDFVYDGVEHVFNNTDVDGMKVVYQQLNTKTGKYEVVEKPAFKNVGGYKFKATVTDALGNERPLTFTVKVATKATVNMELDTGVKVAPGVTYDPWDLLVIEGIGTENKAAAKADKAELLAWVKDYYDIAATADKYDLSKINVTLTAKKFETTAEEKALKDKYATLTGNFSLTGIDLDGEDGWFKMDATASLLNQVEFTATPTAKSFKANTLKKKAKAFTVKAEALSGVAVNYKLINANSKIKVNKTTGKITLKKGLKKGTYKIMVKAYVQAGMGYSAAEETQSIKIKVK